MTVPRFALLFLLFSCSFAQAQKYDLGKVSVKELQETVYPGDTSAVAAILYNKARSKFVYSHKEGFRLEHTYEFRIKIYKQKGLDWANFSVPYYVGYENLNKDMVKFSDAVTYNLENGNIVKTKLNNEGRFKKNVNEFWNEASITMPNVKAGSIVEFKYTLKSEALGEFPVFHFQYGIPVRYSQYITKIPEIFIYRPLIVGFESIKSDAKMESGFQNYENEHHQTLNMSYRQIKATYSGEHIPAMKPERYVDNINNYRAALVHELERTRFPNVPERKFADTWENVAESIYKEKRFGDELRERQYFEMHIDPFVKEAKSDSEKAAFVFDYVKRTMNWDEKFGYLTKKGVKQSFADKTGNAAEINLMLVSMLNHAGIKAYPVLISTINNGIPAFPTRNEFNYVIAAAMVDGKQLLYDATSKNAAANILPFRDLNWTGRMIQTGGVAKEINLVPETVSRQTVNIMAKIDNDGKLSGKAKIIHTDYYAFGFRERYGGVNQENYLENYENENGGIGLSEYLVEHVVDILKPVVEVFNFTSSHHTETIGERIYLNPLLYFTDAVNPFLMETRKFPIYFAFPNQHRYNITIEIPPGYAVESLPKSLTVGTGENVGVFTFNILDKGNAIQISAIQDINLAMVSADFYANVKEFYQKMIDKQNEKIVLKKI